MARGSRLAALRPELHNLDHGITVAGSGVGLACGAGKGAGVNLGRWRGAFKMALLANKMWRLLSGSGARQGATEDRGLCALRSGCGRGSGGRGGDGAVA